MQDGGAGSRLQRHAQAHVPLAAGSSWWGVSHVLLRWGRSSCCKVARPPRAKAVRLAQEVGAGILQQLHAQRQTIERSQQRQQDAHAQLGQADGILRRMSRWWPG